MHELDSRGALTRAEAVKDWLLNKFGFSLLHQGPFCAALLLQVRPASTPPSIPPPCDFLKQIYMDIKWDCTARRNQFGSPAAGFSY